LPSSGHYIRIYYEDANMLPKVPFVYLANGKLSPAGAQEDIATLKYKT